MKTCCGQRDSAGRRLTHFNALPAEHSRNRKNCSYLCSSLDRALQDEHRKPAAQYERAARLIGAFADSEGAKDLSLRHDDHLREAYE